MNSSRSRLDGAGRPASAAAAPQTVQFTELHRMAEIKRLFAGEEHATLYKKYRPDMKAVTVEKIIEFLSEKFNPSECNAVDVGCGSGQATIPLAPFLRHIVGIDPSEAQINQIKGDSNLPDNAEFRVGEAENLPFADSSLQLVTVKQALHWFDIPIFFKEVDRVLQPGGVLAVCCGSGVREAVGIEKEVKILLESVAKEYKTLEMNERQNMPISDLKFPYDEFECHDFLIDTPHVTVQFLSNSLKTRSDMARFIQHDPDGAEQAIKETQDKLMQILGATGSPEETIAFKQAKQTLFLRRKPYPTLINK